MLNAIALVAIVGLVYFLSNRARPHYLQTDVSKKPDGFSPEQYQPEPVDTVQVGEIGEPPKKLGDRISAITDGGKAG